MSEIISRQIEAVRQAMAALAGQNTAAAAARLRDLTDQLTRLQAAAGDAARRVASTPALPPSLVGMSLTGPARSAPTAGPVPPPTGRGPAGPQGPAGAAPRAPVPTATGSPQAGPVQPLAGQQALTGAAGPVPVEVVAGAGVQQAGRPSMPPAGRTGAPDLLGPQARTGPSPGSTLTVPPAARSSPLAGRPQGIDPAASQADMAGQYRAQQERVQLLVRQERERARYLSSPAGTAMLQGQARAAKDLATAQRDAGAARQANDAGGMGAGVQGLRDRVDLARQSFAGLAGAAQSVYSSGMSSIMSLVSAADPFSTWPTYQASVEGLAISVGQTLLPYVDMASGALQRLTRWFDGLSEGAKSWVGGILAGSTAMAGMVFVGGRVVSLLGTVITGARAAASAFMALNAASGPWGLVALGLGAATAGVLTFAGAWGQVGEAAKGAAGSIAGAIGAAADAGGRMVTPGGGERQAVGPKDFRHSLVDAGDQAELMRAGTDPVAVAKALETAAARAEGRYKEAQQRSLTAAAELRAHDEASTAVVQKMAPAARARTEQLARAGKKGESGFTERAAGEFAKRGLADMMTQGRVKPGEEAKIEAEMRQRFELAIRGRADLGSIAQGKAEAEVARRKASKDPADQIPRGEEGAVLAELRQRFERDLRESLNYSTLSADKASKELETLASRAKQSAEYLRGLRERAGVAAGPDGAASPEEGLRRTIAGLPKAQLSDSFSYADRLTIAGLDEAGGQKADNLTKQLMALEKTGELLTRIDETLNRIDGKTVPPRFSGNRRP